jgi:hypothetical protein
MKMPVDKYWNVDSVTLLERLGSTRNGLSNSEAARRLDEYGRNAAHRVRSRHPPLWVSVDQRHAGHSLSGLHRSHPQRTVAG